MAIDHSHQVLTVGDGDGEVVSPIHPAVTASDREQVAFWVSFATRGRLRRRRLLGY